MKAPFYKYIADTWAYYAKKNAPYFKNQTITLDQAEPLKTFLNQKYGQKSTNGEIYLSDIQQSLDENSKTGVLSQSFIDLVVYASGRGWIDEHNYKKAHLEHLEMKSRERRFYFDTKTMTPDEVKELCAFYQQPFGVLNQPIYLIPSPKDETILEIADQKSQLLMERLYQGLFYQISPILADKFECILQEQLNVDQVAVKEAFPPYLDRRAYDEEKFKKMILKIEAMGGQVLPTSDPDIQEIKNCHQIPDKGMYYGFLNLSLEEQKNIERDCRLLNIECQQHADLTLINFDDVLKITQHQYWLSVYQECYKMPVRMPKSINAKREKNTQNKTNTAVRKYKAVEKD